jgi:hypothetical protein
VPVAHTEDKSASARRAVLCAADSSISYICREDDATVMRRGSSIVEGLAINFAPLSSSPIWPPRPPPRRQNASATVKVAPLSQTYGQLIACTTEGRASAARPDSPHMML